MNDHVKVNKVVHIKCHFGFLGHARLLEESMISPHATTISNKEPSWGLKTCKTLYDSYANLWSTNDKIRRSFCSCEMKT